VTDDRDDARRLILARRARFVAAALAGASVACGKEPAPPPQPCLSEPAGYDADTEPRICLSVVAIDPEDAGATDAATDVPADASTDAGATPKRDAAAPRVVRPPVPPPSPPPQPCLSPPRSKDIKR
jgi:hypothetical protein